MNYFFESSSYPMALCKQLQRVRGSNSVYAKENILKYSMFTSADTLADLSDEIKYLAECGIETNIHELKVVRGCARL